MKTKKSKMTKTLGNIGPVKYQSVSISGNAFVERPPDPLVAPDAYYLTPLRDAAKDALGMLDVIRYDLGSVKNKLFGKLTFESTDIDPEDSLADLLTEIKRQSILLATEVSWLENRL